MKHLISALVKLKERVVIWRGQDSTKSPLRWVNRCLTFLVIVLVLYVGHDLMTPESPIEIAPKRVRGDRDRPEQPAHEVTPYDHYTQEIGSWKLFRLPQRPTSKPESSPEVRKKLADLAASFRLAGIVGDRELQAIVVDRKTNCVYYVTKGQFLDEILVEDVQKGKIILKYEGETMELVL